MPIKHDARCKLINLLGPDFPVLVLVWLLYMISLWPLALMQQVKLAILSTPMSIGLGVTFVVFAWGTSKPWEIFSRLCLTASILGAAAGVFLRSFFPVTEDMLPLNYDPKLLELVFFPSAILLITIMVLSSIMGEQDIRIVGSSKEYRPHMAAHLGFGESVGTNFRQFIEQEEILLGVDVALDATSQDLQESQLLSKMYDNVYFSGEPIYDYAFWLANSHTMLGPIFHHPLSPYETGHRVAVLVTICLLIVFPVALVQVLFARFVPDFPFEGVVRLLLMATLVILPRNILKGKLRTLAVQEEGNLRTSISRKQADLRQALKQQTRKIAFAFNGFCLFTIIVCYGSLKAVGRYGHKEIITLLLLNTDGLGFCFILEILFPLVLPRRSKNPRWDPMWGWFGRWHVERIWRMSI